MPIEIVLESDVLNEVEDVQDTLRSRPRVLLAHLRQLEVLNMGDWIPGNKNRIRQDMSFLSVVEQNVKVPL